MTTTLHTFQLEEDQKFEEEWRLPKEILAYLHSRDQRLLEQFVRDMQKKMTQNKDDYIKFKKVPMVTTMQEYPYELGYSQGINNAIGIICDEIPREINPPTTPNASLSNSIYN